MLSIKNKQWSTSTINSNLKEERQTINFDQDQLATSLWGGKE